MYKSYFNKTDEQTEHLSYIQKKGELLFFSRMLVVCPVHRGRKNYSNDKIWKTVLHVCILLFSIEQLRVYILLQDIIISVFRSLDFFLYVRIPLFLPMCC